MIAVFFLIFNFNAFGLERTDHLPKPWDQKQALFDKLDPKMIAAGEELFFDPVLSKNHAIACSSCHMPQFAFSNGREKALGLNDVETEYNVPVLFNRIESKLQFWDGRVHSLREQIFHPILNPKEMGGDEKALIALLNLSPKYKDLFGRKITRSMIETALTSFINSLVSGDSPYDRYVAGDASALSEQDISGKKLFFETYKCDRCHSGPGFTNESMARRCGSAPAQYQTPYKVPTLRNLNESAPYLHNGHLKTLDEVLDFYDQGSNPNGFAVKAEDKPKLVAFLKALSAPIVSYRRAKPLTR